MNNNNRNNSNNNKSNISLKSIGSLTNNDLVFGTDGKWHNIEVQNIHIPEKMYRIFFRNNLINKSDKNNINEFYIDCSGTHEWTLIDKDSHAQSTFTTEQLSNDDFNSIIKNSFIGNINGPIINKIIRINSKESRCILVKDSNDHQFLIFMNRENKENKIRDMSKKFKLL